MGIGGIVKVAIGGIRCGVCRQSGEEKGIVLFVIWRVVRTGTRLLWEMMNSYSRCYLKFGKRQERPLKVIDCIAFIVLVNSNSYLRDILGDILGKDMYYPLTFVKPIRVSLVYKRNPKAQCYVRVRLRNINRSIELNSNLEISFLLNSCAQNVAFVSQSKSSTNKVKSGFSGAYSSCTPSTSSTNIPEKEVLAGFADEVIYSLFSKQTEDLDLLHEDLEQIDDVDIEEMDINWQIAMIAIRMKKFYKKTGRRVRVDGKIPVGFDKKKLECFN
ncbi:hypothetical protein Tco_0590139 [Tanacetum coccineum]